MSSAYLGLNASFVAFGDEQAIERLLRALRENLSVREIAPLIGIGRSTLAKAPSDGVDAFWRDTRRQLEIDLMQLRSERPELFPGQFAGLLGMHSACERRSRKP